MRKTVSLALLTLLVACGPDSEVPPTTGSMPAPKPSYVVGPRDAPQGGQIVVGLLLKRPEPKRLVDLVPPDALAEFIENEARLGDKHPVEPSEAVLLEWDDPAFHAWGHQAKRLKTAMAEFETRTNVHVSFREVLAHECAGIPVVVVWREALETAETEDLAAHEAAGGIVVRPQRDRGVELEYSVPAALDEAVKASPIVHAFDTDPLGVVSATRLGDEIEIELAHANAEVTLRDLDDKVVATGTRTANGRVRLSAPDPALDPFRHFVVLRFAGEDLTLVRGTSVEQLVGTSERMVETGALVRIGSTLALRIRTTNSKTGAPVAGEAGTTVLTSRDIVVASAPYRTDELGFAEVALTVPSSTSPGAAELRVANQVVGTVGLLTDERVSVVTDRTLYKEDDTVNVRVMVHRAGDGRPMPETSVTLKLDDSRKTVVTSEHGIAAATFTLAGAKVGPHKLTASVGDARATAPFRVKAFERPTFLVSVDKPSLTLRKGESVSVILTAKYVNDKPLVRAGVEVVESSNLEVRPFRGRTNADGQIAFHVTAKGGDGRVDLRVVDTDRRSAGVSVSQSRPTGKIVDVRPATQPVAGVPVTLDVVAEGRESVELRVDGGAPTTITLDGHGRGQLEVTPTLASLTVKVAGSTRAFDVFQFDGQRPVVALERRTSRVGETLAGTIVAKDGRVLVEIERDDLLLRMLHVDVVNGHGTFELELDEALAGMLSVRAHHVVDPDRLGTGAYVLVTRGRALDVTATPELPYYRPGSTAAVDVDVKDASGSPTACVLGYWGVDEALLALADFGEGNEEVFDVLGKRTPASVAALARSIEDRSGEPPESLDLIRTVYTADRERYPLAANRTPYLAALAASDTVKTHADQVAALRAAYLDAWEQVPLNEIHYAWTMRGVIGDLVRGGHLDPATLVDAWGTPMALWHDIRGYWYEWASAGPDRTWGTDDDQSATWDGTALYWALPQRILRFHQFVQRHRTVEEDADEVFEETLETDVDFEESFGGLADGMASAPFEGPTTNSAIGIGGGAGGSFRGRGGAARDRESRRSMPVHVRKDFEPTLCFVPEAIVGPGGATRLEIPLKDSITTWKLRLVASRADGATGVGFGQVRVGQPLYATPWLATHLTVGDTLDLPVAVRNEQSIPIEAALKVQVSDALEIVGKTSALVMVGAGETGAHVFTLRAKQRGAGTVRIEVSDGEHVDVQERIVNVRPYAREVIAVKNGTMTPNAILSGAMEIEGAGDVRMDLYATPLADTLSGFEGLIACPHG